MNDFLFSPSSSGARRQRAESDHDLDEMWRRIHAALKAWPNRALCKHADRGPGVIANPTMPIEHHHGNLTTPT